jgi:hypothetical protein
MIHLRIMYWAVHFITYRRYYFLLLTALYYKDQFLRHLDYTLDAS